MVLALVMLAGVVFGRDISVGGLRYSDACTHAMDGVLIHDWVKSGPSHWLDPMAFAVRQYGHYPTLGIGRVYPPGFAVVESVFFAVFGVNPTAARMSVVMFGILAVVGCYFLSRRIMAPAGAACAAAALLAMPDVVVWTRQVMLEMPTLAVLIWALWATLRYLDNPSARRWVPATLLLLAAPMFKQTAVFILPVVFILLIQAALKKRVPWRHVIASVVITGTPPATMLAMTMNSRGTTNHMSNLVSLGRSATDWLNWPAIAFYPSALPGQVGWVILALAGVGLLLFARRPTVTHAAVGLWFLVFAAMSVVIQHKENRYAFFGFLPIAIWAGYAMQALLNRLTNTNSMRFATATAVLIAAAGGYRSDTPVRPDYRPLVRTHESAIRGRVIMFEGHRDGDFVFAARCVLGVQGCVILRGSKLLYSCASDPRFAFTSYVANRSDVARILDPFGLERVFVERENDLNLAEVQMLQDELNDPKRYELLDSQTLVANVGRRSTRREIVDVYKPVHPSPRRLRVVEIPIPIASRTIRIDLDELAAGPL